MPDTSGAPARCSRANAGAARVRGVGLALAGGGPLGGIYEVGALLALADSLDGLDFNDLDVYVGVSSGGFVAAALANGISPAQMYRLFIDDGADAALKPEIFLRPAFGEFAPPRRRRCPASRRARDAAVPARPVPPRRDGVVRDAGARDADRHVRQRRDRRLPRRGCSPRRAAPTTSASCRASCSWSRPTSTPAPRSPSARPGTTTCRSRARSRRRARCPGLFPPVAIDGEHYVDGALNKTLHASVALDEGVELLLCVNPLVPFDAQRGAPRGRLTRRQAEPGRAAAGAVADLPRDHPLADAGRAWRSTGASTRTPTSCCSSPTARTPTCSSPTSSATRSASGCARRRSRKTRHNLRRARARRSRRCSRGTASRSARDRLADPHRDVLACADATRGRCTRDPAPATSARPRATSRTRSTSSSAGSPAGAPAPLTRPARGVQPRRATLVRLRPTRSPAMAEKKRPRRTRERILETSLDAVQPPRRAAHHDGGHRRRDEHQPGQPLLPLPQQGRDHRRAVRRLRGAACCRCSPRPTIAPPDVEDLWLLLHLLFEQMWAYRFLYRDLDETHVAQPRARRRASPSSSGAATPP